MTRYPGINTLDQVLHVAWTMCAFVGLFALARLPADPGALDQLRWPAAVGFAAGVLTSPSVRRRVRSALHRTYPTLFEDPATHP